jgi:short-subunit dehydrogenase
LLRWLRPNAGYTLIGSLEETAIEEAKQLFDTNFFGVLRMTQAVLRFMREQRSGRIVNIGSVVGFVPAPYQGIYCASKHALEGYSESLDHEVRQFGIRVSVIEPGFTRTNIAQNSQIAGRPLEVYADDRNRVLETVSQNIAKGGTPLGVAEVVLDPLTAQSSRSRYPVGGEVKFVGRLRRFAPTKLFDWGLRKQFQLNTA